MTIDQTYTVDTSLALVDAETLMTKAFELTHRIHALGDLREKAQGMAEYEQAHNARAEARAERDAIVREMARRSEGLERALVTVEAAERVMRLADEALAYGRAPSDADRIMRAREALDMGMERTSTTTCSLVKNQTLSDRIAAKAREVVLPIAERVNAMVLR